MHLVRYYPYYSCLCILFGPTIPTYFFNLFSCFLYLFVLIFLSSIATDSEGVWSSTLHKSLARGYVQTLTSILVWSTQEIAESLYSTAKHDHK